MIRLSRCASMNALEMLVQQSRLALLAVILTSLTCGKPEPTAHLSGTPGDWSIGPATARVVLVEYGDYQCPPCVALDRVVTETLTKHPTDVRFIFRHYPTRRHSNAERAAQAAEAGGAQGKFWQMHAQLFEHQVEWYGLADPMPVFAKYARAIGLDMRRFTEDLSARRFRAKIGASKEEGKRLGVRGTPALFINGERVRLPLRSEDLESEIVARFNSGNR